MNTIKFTIYADMDPEMIIAIISGFPFHSFVELEHGVEAYIAENECSEGFIQGIDSFLLEHQMSYMVDVIKFENWNKKWEENFESVVVEDFCCIRADFHKPPTEVKFDLIINPKMAFGTGHHETTRIVISLMRTIDFMGKQVLDFGTGTGVLAILAEKSGALRILAIDNDPLATENAHENLKTNHCVSTEIKTGSIEELSKEEIFDIIIANINLNVLTASVEAIKGRIKPQGLLILSGVMQIHRDLLLQTYQQAGFEIHQLLEEGDWIGVKCIFQG
ncbi:MAG TPA: 50S ribosomal protein L11 methyltransferase [Saprospirales bacterium]|nr:50S ribosomal protein L11 methyltransferase [Saprospirales bacterium]HAY71813.1 50S ribosomal protein L11 methyltransferase [Saprospirales bacterium]HRQ29281.1 50S ribosomal protein L11 methyltransferase [Saprospiraceae bacterium]